MQYGQKPLGLKEKKLQKNGIFKLSIYSSVNIHSTFRKFSKINTNSFCKNVMKFKRICCPE